MEPELDCDAEAARLESEELENEVGIDEMGLEVADGGGRLDSTARVTGGDALPRVADGCGRVAPDARSSVPCYTYKGGRFDHDRSRSITIDHDRYVREGWVDCRWCRCGSRGERCPTSGSTLAQPCLLDR